MNLCNPLVTPAGLRCCYWDAAYIASQSFCITSKLTDKEANDLAEFEELKFWERNEILKKELESEIYVDDFIDDEINCDLLSNFIDVKKAVDLYLLAPKKFYFAGFAKTAKQVGFYNIQPNGGVQPKSKEQTQQIRASFLTR